MKLSEAIRKNFLIGAGISLLTVLICLGAECFLVAFAGAMMRMYSMRIELAGSPDYSGRPADDLMKYWIMYFSLWFFSQIIATLLIFPVSKIISSYVHRKPESGFILSVFPAILVSLWFLIPWFITLSSGDEAASLNQITLFRYLLVPSNILVALILIIYSLKKNKLK